MSGSRGEAGTLYTDAPRLRMVLLVIFLASQWCKSDMNSVETVLKILNLYLFPASDVVLRSALSWCWAVAAGSAPGQPCDHAGQPATH